MTTHHDNEGRFHRDDGPACEHDDGSWAWFRHGKLHRLDGPAVRLVFPDGHVEEQYWINGHECN